MNYPPSCLKKVCLSSMFFGIHSEIIVVKEKTAGHVKVNKVKVCFTQTVKSLYENAKSTSNRSDSGFTHKVFAFSLISESAGQVIFQRS